MKQISLIAISLFPISVIGQNLIPNPSFEEKTGCPSNYTTSYDPIKTVNWYSPSTGTPDLFSSCSLGMMSTPRNFAGIAYPPNGQNYVGMYFGSPRETLDKNYREYLTCQLLSPLKKGEEYKFHFFAKPATYSTYLIDRLTFAFSSDSILVGHDNSLWELNHSTIFVDTVKVTKGWYEIELEFVANGTEKYLTIGDFTKPGEGSFEKMFTAKSQLKEGGSTYYLFDNFSLVPIRREEPSFFVTDKPFSLEKIYFDFDSFKLNKSGFDQLNALSDHLKSKEELTLEIYGNTDTKGSEEYNEKLSLQRAESVKNYLEEQGIDAERLRIFGLGERENIYQFDSLNRRTEFILLERTKSNKHYHP